MGFVFEVIIKDELTFVLSIVVITIAFYYILRKWMQGRHSRDTNLEEEVSRSITDRLRNNNDVLRNVLEDYTTTLEDVERRDSITLLTGSILITASFLLLASVATKQEASKHIFAIASLGIYLVWLVFFHETTQRLDGIALQRARAIEFALGRYFGYGFGIHSYISAQTEEGTVPWLRMVRRIFWYVVLFLLAFLWMLLSISINSRYT